MVTMGVGVMGSTDWSELRQGAIEHGLQVLVSAIALFGPVPRGIVRGAVLLS